MSPKLVTVEQMRRLEAEAVATGVSYATMMALAGQAVAEKILSASALANFRSRINREDFESFTLVLVGQGHNGGDGLVCARHLHDAGATVKVYGLQPPDESDTKVIALRERSVFMVNADNDLQSRILKQLVNSATVIVDAVFGTGVRLPLTGQAAHLLGQVKRLLESDRNESKTRPYVVAVDVPSGVDCDTGAVDANTFAANLTVTFGAAKIGHYLFPAADYRGDLIVAPIGWPESLPTLATVQLELADQPRVQAALPKRSRDSHKYDFGRLLVVAGSRNYVGAAYLVGATATRSGAGLVTLAVPESVQSILAAHLIEATWLPLPESNGFIAESAAEKVAGALNTADAVVLGPGLGVEETTKRFVRAIHELPLLELPLLELPLPELPLPELPLPELPLLELPLPELPLRPPLLIDADGLRLLAQIENWPDLLPKPTILTPHLGEMQALTGIDKEDIQKDRLGIAKRFAREWGQIVLLKGAFTVIAAPDGRAVIEPFATPALAKAGSGDVLSGLIGSLLAQGVEPFEAAVAGAFIHGRAGERAAKELGTTVSVTARDYVTVLAKVFAELEVRG